MRRHNIIIIAVAVVLLAGCKTKERVVSVEHQTTDTLWQTQVQRDSIYIIDSTYIYEWTDGDTVHITRDRWKTRYVERVKRDTVYRSKTDTVNVACETVREVPRRLTWWQQVRLWVGTGALMCAGALMGVALWMAVRAIRRR